MVIKCKYNVTKADDEQYFISSLLNVDSMKVDGVEIPREVEREVPKIDDEGKETEEKVLSMVPNIKMFFTEGEHEIEFFLKEDADTVSNSMFGKVDILTECILPEGITEIMPYAFYCCNNLKKVELPKSLTAIMEHAFSGSKVLSDVVIPAGLTTIKEYAFEGCSELKNVVIPLGVTSLGDCAFANTAIENIFFHQAFEEINNGCFMNCKNLKSITIPSNITKLGDGAFLNCNELESVTIQDGLAIIGNFAFENDKKLTKVEFGNTIETIGFEAFRNCESLKDVVLPATLISIGNYAFENCADNFNIELKCTTPPSLGDNPFKDTIARGFEISVPDESEELYNDEDWVNRLTGAA